MSIPELRYIISHQKETKLIESILFSIISIEKKKAYRDIITFNIKNSSSENISESYNNTNTIRYYHINNTLKKDNEERIQAFFDAFLLITKSYIELLAPLIDKIFYKRIKRDSFYKLYTTIQTINNENNFNKLKEILNGLEKKYWHKNLHELRNDSAHRYIINMDDNFEIKFRNGKKEDLIEFCDKIISNSDTFVNTIIQELTDLIKNNNYKIPII